MSVYRWFINHIKVIGLVSGTLVSVAGAFAVLEIEFPRPAWSNELQELAENVIELDNVISSQQLDDTKLRLYQNQREQRLWKDESGTIPDFLINEKVLLERKIDNLENRLEKLRNLDNG